MAAEMLQLAHGPKPPSPTLQRLAAFAILRSRGEKS
jgi:hypothetical protein